MSELNRVIEDRLAAAETGVAGASAAADSASAAAAAAQTTANSANAKVCVGSSAPDSPAAGKLWSDTGTNTLKLWNGTAWLTFATV